jgi:hypothetical protein
MTSKRINSKGQVIEELDLEELEVNSYKDIRGPFQSPKPTSPKRNNIEKMEPTNNDTLYSIPQNQKEAIDEMIAWSTYYLDCKKKNRELRHISFWN